VCLLPDGSAWMFAMSELPIGRKMFLQLTATDITERWKLTEQLSAQNEELARRKEELDAAIANLHIVSRERETRRAKMRAHDILGERLTLMMRTIGGKREFDYAMLRALSSELMEELRAAKGEPAPQERLAVLRQVFEAVGVGVRLRGELPRDAQRGGLVADIARETVTNAVRHAFATKIDIDMAEEAGGFRMTIADNGHPPSEPVAEGGGLSGIRERVKQMGGTVRVSASPRFVLTVDLPGGGTDG
jgi:signal transduction histidine kinase